MSKDLYGKISAHFGIESVENFVANRRNRYINRYGETDNYLCQMLRWLVRLSEGIFYLLRLFNFCLLNFFSFMLCYHVRWWNKFVDITPSTSLIFIQGI